MPKPDKSIAKLTEYDPVRRNEGYITGFLGYTASKEKYRIQR